MTQMRLAALVRRPIVLDWAGSFMRRGLTLLGSQDCGCGRL
jgi:hypothetical protein